MKFNVTYSQQTTQAIVDAFGEAQNYKARDEALMLAIAQAYEEFAQQLASNPDYEGVVANGEYPVSEDFLKAIGLTQKFYAIRVRAFLYARIAKIKPLANGLTREQMAANLANVISGNPIQPTPRIPKWFNSSNAVLATATIAFIILSGLTFGGIIAVSSIPAIGLIYNAIAGGGGAWSIGLGLTISKPVLASAVSLVIGFFTTVGITVVIGHVVRPCVSGIKWAYYKLFPPKIIPLDRSALNQQINSHIAAIQFPVLAANVKVYHPEPVKLALCDSTISAMSIDNMLRDCPSAFRSKVVHEHYQALVEQAATNRVMLKDLNNLSQYAVLEDPQKHISDVPAFEQAREQFVKNHGVHVTVGLIVNWKRKHPELSSTAVSMSNALIQSPIHKNGEASPKTENKQLVQTGKNDTDSDDGYESDSNPYYQNGF